MGTSKKTRKRFRVNKKKAYIVVKKTLLIAKGIADVLIAVKSLLD